MKQPEIEPLIESEENQPLNQVENNTSDIALAYRKNRIRVGLVMAFIGYLIFLLGARPSMFGLDRSPVVGFVQISVFLLGLAVISLGNYLVLNALWPEGQKTIAAEIGSRLISTGYVICVFAGMADIFGLGSHPLPNVLFGPLQARGMNLGIMTIAIGFLLLIRYRRYPRDYKKTVNPTPPPPNETPPQDQTQSDQFKIKLSTLFR
ncbi:MAG: hypothetical protein GX142_04450 [Chloroflexi bacterium]|jgi:hypothetical protein|nr:hypothetical protein [Chloroflexota bacterium]